MNILGIDPGLRVTGWAVVSAAGRRRHVVATGSIRVPTQLTHLQRVAFAVEEAKTIVHTIQAKRAIDLAAVEDYRYQGARSHSKAAFAIAELVGRLKQLVTDAGIILVDGIDKNAANRALGLTGKVSSARVRLAVKRMVPPVPVVNFETARVRPLANEHECDAVLVAVAAHQRWTVASRRSA